MTGQNVRNLRQKRGMTQWQLSRAVGVTPGKILLIERGDKDCPSELVKAIAQALNVDESEITK